MGSGQAKRRKGESTKRTELVNSHEEFESLNKKVKVEIGEPVNCEDSGKTAHIHQVVTPSPALSTVASELCDDVAAAKVKPVDSSLPTKSLSFSIQLEACNADELNSKRKILELSYNDGGKLVYHVGYEEEIAKQPTVHTKEEIMKEDPLLLVYFYEKYMKFRGHPGFTADDLDKLER